MSEAQDPLKATQNRLRTLKTTLIGGVSKHHFDATNYSEFKKKNLHPQSNLFDISQSIYLKKFEVTKIFLASCWRLYLRYFSPHLEFVVFWGVMPLQEYFFWAVGVCLCGSCFVGFSTPFEILTVQTAVRRQDCSTRSR